MFYIHISMSEIEWWKQLLNKTNFANVAAFIMVIGYMAYGIRYNDRDAIVASGSTALGYLFGTAVNSNK